MRFRSARPPLALAPTWPSFFANLVPETGELRTLLERRFAIERADDAALLVALGSDLPGAVTVRGEDSVDRPPEPVCRYFSRTATTSSFAGWC